MVRGYDFLVNAVWPEVVQNIEARIPSIFAPGNPDIFHQVSSLVSCFIFVNRLTVVISVRVWHDYKQVPAC